MCHGDIGRELRHGIRADRSASGRAHRRAVGSTRDQETVALDACARVFTSNPKLGTTLGVMGGYIHLFDPKSRPSVFAATAQYSNTESIVGGVFARTSFDADHQRLNIAVAFGNIKNDYDDYLGTGVPLRNNVELKSFISRYLYRVYGD